MTSRRVAAWWRAWLSDDPRPTAASRAVNRASAAIGRHAMAADTVLAVLAAAGTVPQLYHHFARWVWSQAGTNTAGLSPAAYSFYSYGTIHHAWHSGLSGVSIGDAVVFGLNTSAKSASHVGLVVSVSGGVVMISGNSGPDSNHDLYVYRASIASASGYTVPTV